MGKRKMYYFINQIPDRRAKDINKEKGKQKAETNVYSK